MLIEPTTSIVHRTNEQITLEQVLKDDFIASLRPRTPEYRSQLNARYADYLSQYRERLSGIPIETLQATGEYPQGPTPYDLVFNPSMQSPEDILAGLVDRHIYLEVLTHPAICHSFERTASEPWQRLDSKEVPVLDRAEAEREVLTFEDLALGIPDRQAEISSAQALLGFGLPMWVTDQTVALPISGSSMRALNTARKAADLGIAGCMDFAPVDNIYKDPKNQAVFIRRSFQLVDEDPFVVDHPNGQYLKDRSRGLIGVTLKAEPDDAIARVQTILDLNADYFDGKQLLCRLYDPRS